MKIIKTRFSRRGILALLAINWLVIIMVTNCPIAKEMSSNSSLWALIVGFTLQFVFLSDQLKNRES